MSGLILLQVQTRPSGGKIGTVTGARNYTRKVTFNADGEMLSSAYPAGTPDERKTTYSYYTDSRLLELSTDPLGRATRRTYDGKGNIQNVTILYGTSDAVATS
jgi:YD repeat-containing protein